MRARIFQPPKNAMQSGRAGTHEWVLDFEPSSPRRPDPLMGWIGSADTQTQVRLTFRDARGGRRLREEAQASTTIWNWRSRGGCRPKAYADNFRYGRIENWTH